MTEWYESSHLFVGHSAARKLEALRDRIAEDAELAEMLPLMRAHADDRWIALLSQRRRLERLHQHDSSADLGRLCERLSSWPELHYALYYWNYYDVHNLELFGDGERVDVYSTRRDWGEGVPTGADGRPMRSEQLRGEPSIWVRLARQDASPEDVREVFDRGDAGAIFWLLGLEPSSVFVDYRHELEVSTGQEEADEGWRELFALEAMGPSIEGRAPVALSWFDAAPTSTLRREHGERWSLSFQLCNTGGHGHGLACFLSGVAVRELLVPEQLEVRLHGAGIVALAQQWGGLKTRRATAWIPLPPGRADEPPPLVGGDPKLWRTRRLAVTLRGRTKGRGQGRLELSLDAFTRSHSRGGSRPLTHDLEVVVE